MKPFLSLNSDWGATDVFLFSAMLCYCPFDEKQSYGHFIRKLGGEYKFISVLVNYKHNCTTKEIALKYRLKVNIKSEICYIILELHLLLDMRCRGQGCIV